MIIFLLSLGIMALFCGCKQTLNYVPKIPIVGNYIIYEEYLSSSKIKEVKVESEKEKVATAFEIHTNVSIKNDDHGTTISWQPKQFLSNGWNKTLLARILQKQIDLEVKLKKNGDLISFTGFDKLKSKLSKIRQDPDLQKRLFSRIDTSYYKNLWLDRWHLITLLKPGSYAAGQKLPVDHLNRKLKTLVADSVIIRGERNARTNPCIEYTVHYSKKDSFNLELEGMVTVHKKNLLANAANSQISKLQIQTANFMQNHPIYGQITRPGLVDNLDVQGTWRISVSVTTGLPCYEFKKEETQVELVDSISNRVNVTFFRTNENGFKTF